MANPLHSKFVVGRLSGKVSRMREDVNSVRLTCQFNVGGGLLPVSRGTRQKERGTRRGCSSSISDNQSTLKSSAIRSSKPKPAPPKGSSARKDRLDLWLATLVFILVFAAFVQVRTHDFVSFDDPIYVTENPQVRAGLTVDGVVWAFTTFRDANWFPLTWLSHMLDVQLFGIDPGLHHLTNVLLHALAAVILFLALRRMTGQPWPSLVVALLFGVHPLHVESVAWIAERKDVLSALFWMLTLWAYASYAAKPSRSRYALALVLFCLGLMAKQMLVTLPLVLVLLDLWPLRRGLRLAEKIPFFIVSVAAGIVTMVSHSAGGAVASSELIPLAIRIENSLIAYVVYILQSFWPTRLAFFYPYPLHSILVPAILSGIALIAISVLALRAYSQRSYLAIGWFWYLITLLPVIGFIQTGSQARADRYTYIPLIGLSIAVVWWLASVLHPWPRVRTALATAVVVACFALTWIQVQYWRDSFTLYQHAIEVVPDNYIARFNLAYALQAQGRTAEAVEQLRATVAERPGYVPARAELGQLLAQQGRTSEAIEQLQIAVTMRPDDPVAHYRYGSVLGTVGRPADAAAQFAEVIRLQPDNADAHFNYGTALAELDRIPEAVSEFEATIRLRPQDADAHFNLGIALARLNRIDEAIAQFDEAVRLRPNFAAAREALDRALSMKGMNPNR
jgi:tetratricopeptide (TPR) repeat protein